MLGLSYRHQPSMLLERFLCCREKGKAEFKKVGVTLLINLVAYEQCRICMLSSFL